MEKEILIPFPSSEEELINGREIKIWMRGWELGYVERMNEIVKMKKLNFCQLDKDVLFKLFKFLKVYDIACKSECIKKMVGDDVVEMEWNFYDSRLIVRPDTISVGYNTLLTLEEYLNMVDIFTYGVK